MAEIERFRIDANITMISLDTGQAYGFEYIKQCASLEISDGRQAPDIFSILAVMATEGVSVYTKESAEGDDGSE